MIKVCRSRALLTFFSITCKLTMFFTSSRRALVRVSWSTLAAKSRTTWNPVVVLVHTSVRARSSIYGGYNFATSERSTIITLYSLVLAARIVCYLLAWPLPSGATHVWLDTVSIQTQVPNTASLGYRGHQEALQCIVRTSQLISFSRSNKIQPRTYNLRLHTEY